MVQDNTVTNPLEKSCLGNLRFGNDSELGQPPLQIQAGLSSLPSPSGSIGNVDNGYTSERVITVNSGTNSVARPVVMSNKCLVVISTSGSTIRGKARFKYHQYHCRAWPREFVT